MNTAEKVIQLTLSKGLRRYKKQNSTVSLHLFKEQEKFEEKILNGKKNKKGSIFITRSKGHLNAAGTIGVVLSSEEAVLDHIDMASHWTPNVYNYGTYMDESKTIVKGHEERNLQQINCFVVDVDTKDVTPGEIVLAAMDKQLDMPTFILESPKGYQAYFVLDKPLYVSNKNNYRCIAVAKRISENIRKALSEELPGVDQACNHFGFFRMPNEHNVVWYQEDRTCNLAELIAWSKDQDLGYNRRLFTVFSNQEFSCNQIAENWVDQVLNLTEIKGQKGVIGRDNAMFTLALACYSSGKSEEDTYNLLDEYNSTLGSPLKNQEIQKVIRSAFKGKWKGASKEYIKMLLETWTNNSEVSLASFGNPRGWYKFKKERKDRVRSHLYEWEEDMIKYLHSHKDTKKGFIYFTQKELCEALNIPRSTLNKLLNKSTRIYRHVVGTGNKKQTGLATLAMLFNYVMEKKEEQIEKFVYFIRELVPCAANKVLTLLKGRRLQRESTFDSILNWDKTG